MIEPLFSNPQDDPVDPFVLLLLLLRIIFFSATMPLEVLEVTNRFMPNPIRILVKRDELTLEGIRQFYVAVERYAFSCTSVLSRLACMIGSIH